MTSSTNSALAAAQARRTCKAYDATRKIDESTLQTLLNTLRLAPSSINIQPWKFLVTDRMSTKNLITKSMVDGDAHNVPKVNNASHILILCTRTDLDDAHLSKVLQAEKDAGRFGSDAIMQARFDLCQYYISQMQTSPEKLLAWSENQTFIALGHLLMACAMMGIDATPIGGYDQALLDAERRLADQGLKSSVLVAIGYASHTDANQQLPKARLAFDEVVSFI